MQTTKQILEASLTQGDIQDSPAKIPASRKPTLSQLGLAFCDAIQQANDDSKMLGRAVSAVQPGEDPAPLDLTPPEIDVEGLVGLVNVIFKDLQAI
ncbi:hypothetical protein PDIDSM_6043 [Penicillium digitatum]|nr:hypothetical protein PDIDSM_6043 [Penicillium digitatum]